MLCQALQGLLVRPPVLLGPHRNPKRRNWHQVQSTEKESEARGAGADPGLQGPSQHPSTASFPPEPKLLTSTVTAPPFIRATLRPQAFLLGRLLKHPTLPGEEGKTPHLHPGSPHAALCWVLPHAALCWVLLAHDLLAVVHSLPGHGPAFYSRLQVSTHRSSEWDWEVASLELCVWEHGVSGPASWRPKPGTGRPQHSAMPWEPSGPPHWLTQRLLRASAKSIPMTGPGSVQLQVKDGTPALPTRGLVSPMRGLDDLPATRSCSRAFPEPPGKQPRELKRLPARASQPGTHLLLQPQEGNRRVCGGPADGSQPATS